MAGPFITDTQSGRELLLLGLELLFIFALALVAEQPGWGAPVVLLLVLLWAVFLFSRADAFQQSLNQILHPAGTPGLKLQPGTAGQ